MSFLLAMAVKLPERALLVKLFYENMEMTQLHFEGFVKLRIYTKDHYFQKLSIFRFEKTGCLRVQPCRGRKLTITDIIEDVATAIVENQ